MPHVESSPGGSESPSFPPVEPTAAGTALSVRGRDMRDPQKLGEVYLAKRATGLSIARAVKLRVDPVVDVGPLERYGEPGKHTPVWERIQVK